MLAGYTVAALWLHAVVSPTGQAAIHNSDTTRFESLNNIWDEGSDSEICRLLEVGQFATSYALKKLKAPLI